MIIKCETTRMLYIQKSANCPWVYNVLASSRDHEVLHLLLSNLMREEFNVESYKRLPIQKAILDAVQKKGYLDQFLNKFLLGLYYRDSYLHPYQIFDYEDLPKKFDERLLDRMSFYVVYQELGSDINPDGAQNRQYNFELRSFDPRNCSPSLRSELAELGRSSKHQLVASYQMEVAGNTFDTFQSMMKYLSDNFQTYNEVEQKAVVHLSNQYLQMNNRSSLFHDVTVNDEEILMRCMLKDVIYFLRHIFNIQSDQKDISTILFFKIISFLSFTDLDALNQNVLIFNQRL